MQAYVWIIADFLSPSVLPKHKERYDVNKNVRYTHVCARACMCMSTETEGTWEDTHISVAKESQQYLRKRHLPENIETEV